MKSQHAKDARDGGEARQDELRFCSWTHSFHRHFLELCGSSPQPSVEPAYRAQVTEVSGEALEVSGVSIQPNGCFFIVLMVSFAGQKLFSLMSSHLVLSAFVAYAFHVISKKPSLRPVSRSHLSQGALLFLKTDDDTLPRMWR